jgi:hypothetical protein
MANASNEMTEHAEAESGTYKPKEHDGLKQDGTPDKRVSSEHGPSRTLTTTAKDGSCN